MMDPNNPVVLLCVQGMQAEMAKDSEGARDAYERAWATRQDAFESSIAAHYLARVQSSPEGTRRWNAEALSQAEFSGDERVQPLLPSLYLNMGYSHELAGEYDFAEDCYVRADALLDSLPPEGHYGDVVRFGVSEGRRRISAYHLARQFSTDHTATSAPELMR